MKLRLFSLSRLKREINLIDLRGKNLALKQHNEKQNVSKVQLKLLAEYLMSGEVLFEICHTYKCASSAAIKVQRYCTCVMNINAVISIM